jgi:hypothetical protein
MIVASLFFTCSALPARGESAAVRIVELRAGFDGHFKVGYWTPVVITLEGGGESASGVVEVVVLDGDAVPSRVRTSQDHPLTIGAGEKVSVSLYVKIGQLNSDVTVNFRGDDALLASRTYSTASDPELMGIRPSGQELIVAFGAPFGSDDRAARDERGTRIANLADLADLPGDWFGYEGATAVVIATGSDEVAAQLAGDSPQLAALDQWVRMGGKLVLCVGRQGEKVLAAGSSLAKLAPGRLDVMVPLRQSTALETYAETTEPLDTGGVAFVLHVPKLLDVRGKIEAYAGLHARDLPLVVRTPHGFGEIVFVAFDVELAPLAEWNARSQLFDKLLRRSKSSLDDGDSGTLGQVTTLGFVDLAGQLRGALDQFTGVHLAPFWLVALLALAYIVCIGPLDYFIVKNVLRRMEATWLTFAITVVLFSGGAVALAYALKGHELRVNQVDLVDFDAQSGRVRGTTWINVFSPQIDTFDLSLRPAVSGATDSGPSDSGVLFSWMGLPGNGFGGMNPRAGSLPLFTEPYDFSEKLDRMERVPIAVWASKSFTGRWWQQGTGQVEAQLTDKGKLVGTLTSRLDVPLDDSVLLYDRWAYPIRQLKPGQQVDIESQLDPQTVDTYLRRVTSEGDRNLAVPYDPASFDVPRIVEIMTSYELSGGEKYAGLTNEYQGFVDSSMLVRDGRAVLIGRIARPATELERDGKPLVSEGKRQWTFFRYVFVVEE